MDRPKNMKINKKLDEIGDELFLNYYKFRNFHFRALLPNNPSAKPSL